MHWLAVLLGATLATPALAEIKTNALFADHVVLQTTDDGGAGALVGGTATPGETVTLALAGAAAHSFTGVASATGAWVVAANLTSGGPYTMTLKGSKSTNVLTATDALVGDVVRAGHSTLLLLMMMLLLTLMSSRCSTSALASRTWSSRSAPATRTARTRARTRSRTRRPKLPRHITRT